MAFVKTSFKTPCGKTTGNTLAIHWNFPQYWA